jgi:hypothetical protein
VPRRRVDVMRGISLNSVTGSGSITPSAPTRPAATELPRSSSPNGPPHPNLRSVTNLLDEYRRLTKEGG